MVWWNALRDASVIAASNIHLNIVNSESFRILQSIIISFKTAEMQHIFTITIKLLYLVVNTFSDIQAVSSSNSIPSGPESEN